MLPILKCWEAEIYCNNSTSEVVPPAMKDPLFDIIDPVVLIFPEAVI